MGARVDLYGEELYIEYTESFQDNLKFLASLEKHGMDIVLL